MVPPIVLVSQIQFPTLGIIVDSHSISHNLDHHYNNPIILLSLEQEYYCDQTTILKDTPLEAIIPSTILSLVPL